jgi:hypothetical protein
LLNEINEVKRLFSGDFNRTEGLYRDCFLLSKYYKEQGMNAPQIRIALFKWAKESGVILDLDINGVITKAMDDKNKLTDKIEIYVSREEIKDILGTFDHPDVRLVAFCLLVFAKGRMSKNKMFDISLPGLSNWSGVSLSSMKKRILKELEIFGFMEKINADIKGNSLSYNKTNKFYMKHNTYKLLFKVYDDKDFLVTDEDIRKEFEDIQKLL